MQGNRYKEHLSTPVSPSIFRLIVGIVGFLFVLVLWFGLSGFIAFLMSLLITPIVYDVGHESGNGLSIILWAILTFVALVFVFIFLIRRLFQSVKDWIFRQHVEYW